MSSKLNLHMLRVSLTSHHLKHHIPLSLWSKSVRRLLHVFLCVYVFETGTVRSSLAFALISFPAVPVNIIACVMLCNLAWTYVRMDVTETKSRERASSGDGRGGGAVAWLWVLLVGCRKHRAALCLLEILFWLLESALSRPLPTQGSLHQRSPKSVTQIWHCVTWSALWNDMYIMWNIVHIYSLDFP